MAVRSIDSAKSRGDVDGAPVTARARKRLETRQRIFECAMDVFREVGFQAAQIDRIVERAGVARGTFYFHFETKEHVLLECQSQQEIEIVERMREMGPPPESVKEYMKRVLVCMAGGQDDDYDLGREILAMYIRQPANIRPSAFPLMTEILDYFIEAADRGAVRDDIPPEVLAIRFLGSFFLLVMSNGVVDINSDEWLEIIDTAIELHFTGLQPQPN